MRVTAFETPSRMEWTGGLPLGLFVGRRTFTVKSVGDRQPEIDSFSAALKAHAEAKT
jgi:hypothetical protein